MAFINVRGYFGSCKVRGERNSVIFIDREILSGPEDARICFIFFNDNEELKEVIY